MGAMAGKQSIQRHPPARPARLRKAPVATLDEDAEDNRVVNQRLRTDRRIPLQDVLRRYGRSVER